MFKVILEIAGRNAFLRRRRAILLILMIGLSMGVMVALEGLYDGMSLHMIDKTKRSDSGEISLYAPHYRLERDIAYRIDNAAEKTAQLKQLPQIGMVLYRLEVDGLAQTARKSQPATLIGIDLTDEERFGAFGKFLLKGTLTFEKRGVFIGSEVARKLKLDIGSRVIFTAQDSHKEIQSIALRVNAVIRSSNVLLDDRALYIPREKVAKFLAVDPRSGTQIAVRSESDDMVALQQEIKRLFPGLDVLTFRELYPQLKQMQQLMDVFNGITFAIVMLVVFIGILGVMYVSILDRIREFGILLSIGYAFRYIRRQIMLEALLLGLAGYGVGVVVGFSLLAYLKYQGLDLSIFSEGLSLYGLDPVIYATIKSSYFISTLLAIIAASLLSVWLPLRKIKKFNPVDVIRSAG